MKTFKFILFRQSVFLKNFALCLSSIGVVVLLVLHPSCQPETPQVQNKKRSNTSALIDSLLQEKINVKRLNTAPQADKYTLIRRLSYVLTGLPPSP